MSHRMRIGILNKDGTVNTIYLHANGYLTDAGAQLIQYWNSIKRARQLISGGGITNVGAFFDEEEADAYEEKVTATLEEHNLFYVGTPRIDVRGYHRYASEKPNAFPIETWKSLDEFYKDECFNFVFGLYLWKRGAWWYIGQKYGGRSNKAQPLAPELLKLAVEKAQIEQDEE